VLKLFFEVLNDLVFSLTMRVGDNDIRKIDGKVQASFRFFDDLCIGIIQLVNHRLQFVVFFSFGLLSFAFLLFVFLLFLELSVNSLLFLFESLNLLLEVVVLFVVFIDLAVEVIALGLLFLHFLVLLFHLCEVFLSLFNQRLLQLPDLVLFFFDGV